MEYLPQFVQSHYPAHLGLFFLCYTAVLVLTRLLCGCILIGEDTYNTKTYKMIRITAMLSAVPTVQLYVAAGVVSYLIIVGFLGMTGGEYAKYLKRIYFWGKK